MSKSALMISSKFFICGVNFYRWLLGKILYAVDTVICLDNYYNLFYHPYIQVQVQVSPAGQFFLIPDTVHKFMDPPASIKFSCNLIHTS